MVVYDQWKLYDEDCMEVVVEMRCRDCRMEVVWRYEDEGCMEDMWR
jgi:hypothetical protein